MSGTAARVSVGGGTVFVRCGKGDGVKKTSDVIVSEGGFVLVIVDFNRWELVGVWVNSRFTGVMVIGGISVLASVLAVTGDMVTGIGPAVGELVWISV